ncbi:hypothetical protein CMV_020307 [Castanea mollissima]|uniref:1-phosphatidylinositol-3-phosphate 5-kinase n=1 Tax=Castanea mollissima TaxID=60419 RepID=A0A8J4R1G7_9ROSI|nr:hypothetical protein CMV_020307 [Castanea mollissima]
MLFSFLFFFFNNNGKNGVVLGFWMVRYTVVSLLRCSKRLPDAFLKTPESEEEEVKGILLLASDSKGFEMLTSDSKMGCRCCECNMKLSQNSYSCRSCGRWVCGKCIRGYEVEMGAGVGGGSMSIKWCNFCSGKRGEGVIMGRKGGGSSEKVHPAVSPLESPRESPEPPSPPPPCFCRSGEGIRSESIRSDRLAHYLETREFGYSPNAMISSRSMMMLSSFSGHPSPESVRRSPYRSDEDEAEDSGKQFFSPSSEYCHDNSDIDSSSLSARHEFYSCRSVGSSPSDSPSRIYFTSNRVGHTVQQGQEGSPYSQNVGPFIQPIMAILRKPDLGTEDPDNNDDCSDDLAIFRNPNEESQRPLDFENNGLIWFPPLPDDENDEAESNFFSYDDDDDDIGDSGAMFSSSSSLVSVFPAKEKQNEGNKEPLRAVVHGHFRALVSQLLQGEGIKVGKENDVEDWLDIVTTLAWHAANFVKPDTSRGGSMDPVDYVKVKCAASGSPSESTLIKGVVCTKNIKHKRMTSQYKNPRLLLLGGALEYQKVPNELASFDTLLQQEKDHLKMIISKIENLRPNVLLVEKSVSSYAQEQLLAREISLVLNVKRPLLERIAQCTGAIITPSNDKISMARLGHCELFRLERVSEEHETANQFNKKPSKTLMFFEGCPRRLGCTVLLKGTCRDELKKVKRVVQYAVFAAYHLSLETSFLADEGASLPKMTLKHSIAVPERTTTPDLVISVVPNSFASTSCPEVTDDSVQDEEIVGLNPAIEGLELLGRHLDPVHPTGSMDCRVGNAPSDACYDDLASSLGLDSSVLNQCEDFKSMAQDQMLAGEMNGSTRSERADENEVSSEYFSAAETHPSILVSFSSHCVLKGIVCERSRLLRIKFYGCFDKPLGRYLRDDLFAKTCCCRSCKEPVEAHVLCFTHRQGNLTINVRCLPDIILPGERDGKIWMWHRCLRCAHVDGVPPATRRVVMSDAAWGLSFGKFLELSFSNHATANRVAPCGHSLQRDCLRYYGFGSMVAFFRYSPIDILSVHLPPPVLEFNGHVQHEWTRKEAAELVHKMETLYAEISDVLESLEEKCKSFGNECSDTNDLQGHMMELKDLLKKERNDYNGLLQPAIMETSQPDWLVGDILELNRLRRSLLVASRVWDQRLCSLDSLLKNSSISKAAQGDASYAKLKELKSELSHKDGMLGIGLDFNHMSSSCQRGGKTFRWGNELQAGSVRQISQNDNPPFRRLMLPMRVHSFDSALRVQERIRKGLPPSSLHLSTIRSFHASGDYRSMVRDPVSNVMRTYSQMLPWETQKLNLTVSSTPTFISSASHMAEGARLLLTQTGHSDIVIAVYENEPTSIISYALSSKEYNEWVADHLNEHEGSWSPHESSKEDSAVSTFSAWQSFGSLEFDYIHYGSYGSEDASSSMVDFVRSLSRCRTWSAQGGKSNVYFAKSLDERFIIKQVTKTELDSFVDFAPQYFKYLTESLNSRSPTCLAKILGIYQVSVKHLKGGKETKMDLMVMENLFFKRNISRVYDLKGSARARYNSDTTGTNKVLLDMNLLETLRTKPIFLGSKAKRSLERAVWNDTSFLASVDVMDYSLLVGVDDERKELVLGIIDFMRQYTWDKHLETWVKASGILGGPKNASPTIISPKQYKKRFRKAMTTYFLTVPDQFFC